MNDTRNDSDSCTTDFKERQRPGLQPKIEEERCEECKLTSDISRTVSSQCTQGDNRVGNAGDAAEGEWMKVGTVAQATGIPPRGKELALCSSL